MWIAIKQFNGALVAGQRRRYLPGDAVPEASGWRNPEMWRQWILEVPDCEVVDGRWINFERHASRVKARPEKAAPPVVVPVAAPPVQPAVVTQFAPPVESVPPDAAPSVDASGETQAEGDRPKRRRRSSLVGQQ